MKKRITARMYKVTECQELHEFHELKINNSNILFLRSVLLSNNSFYEDENGNWLLKFFLGEQYEQVIFIDFSQKELSYKNLQVLSLSKLIIDDSAFDDLLAEDAFLIWVDLSEDRRRDHHRVSPSLDTFPERLQILVVCRDVAVLRDPEVGVHRDLTQPGKVLQSGHDPSVLHALGELHHRPADAGDVVAEVAVQLPDGCVAVLFAFRHHIGDGSQIVVDAGSHQLLTPALRLGPQLPILESPLPEGRRNGAEPLPLETLHFSALLVYRHQQRQPGGPQLPQLSRDGGDLAGSRAALTQQYRRPNGARLDGFADRVVQSGGADSDHEQLPSLLLRGQGISHHPAPYPGRCWRRRGGCCRCKLRRVIQATRVRAGVGRALRSSRRASGQCQGTGRSRGEATKRTACIAGFCHRSPPDPE